MEKKVINDIVEGFISFIRHDDLPFDIVDSMLESVSYIEEIDKELAVSCNASIINRVDYYEFIYKRNIFEKLVETYKDNVSWVNFFIYEAINVEFLKIMLYHEIIENIEKIKHTTEDESLNIFKALKEVAIERKNECINFINTFKQNAMNYNHDEKIENDSLSKEDIESFVRDNRHILQ